MMRYVALCVSFFFSCLVVADDAGLAEQLARIDTYQAEFIQKQYSSDKQLQKTLTGIIKLKKPQLFFWEVTEPEKLLVVSNGEDVWNFDEELEQAVKYTLNHDVKGTPIALLTSKAEDLDAEYWVERLDASNCFDEDAYCYQMKPKDPEKGFDKIHLGLEDDKIKFLKVWDVFGNITEYKFEKAKSNMALSDKIFEFNPDENIDVVIGN